MFIGHEESRLAGETDSSEIRCGFRHRCSPPVFGLSRQARDEAGGTYHQCEHVSSCIGFRGTRNRQQLQLFVDCTNLNETDSLRVIDLDFTMNRPDLNLNVLPIIDSMMSIDQDRAADGWHRLVRLGLSAGEPVGLGGQERRMLRSGLCRCYRWRFGGGQRRGRSNTPHGFPGMTENEADAILDFIDTDDETREYGAERDYYAQLPSPLCPSQWSASIDRTVALGARCHAELAFWLGPKPEWSSRAVGSDGCTTSRATLNDCDRNICHIGVGR